MPACFWAPAGGDKLLAKLLQKVRLPGVPVCQASIDALVRVYRLVYVTVMMSF